MTHPRTDARATRPRRAGLLTAALLTACALAAPAQAQDTPRKYVAMSLLAGSAQPDGQMADYQWDVRPHAAYGAELLAGRGRWAAGARVSAGSTTQALGLSGIPDARVSRTRIELVTRARLARLWNVGFAVTGSAGRLGLAYRPDHVTVDAGGSPIEVTLAPIHTPVYGGGIAFEGPLTAGWAWGAGIDRRWFALDTAHRSGSEVVFARETFGDWDAHLVLTHAWDW